MVTADNEWLNNYEDEQKSTTAADNSTPSITTNTSNIPTNNVLSATPSISAATTVTTDIQPIASTSSTVNDFRTHINNNNTKRQQQVFASDNKLLINNKRLKMGDSLKNDCETSENQNNNRDLGNTTFIHNSNPSANSSSNTSIQTLHVNSATNSSDTCTALNNQYAVSNTTNTSYCNQCPITAQALSSAIQSVLSCTASNTPTTVSMTLPSGFLSSLSSVVVTPSATMQHKANLIKSSASSPTLLESKLSSSITHDIIVDVPHQQMSPADSNNGLAKIVLHCEPNSHPFQTRSILLTPNVECKVGRLIAKSKASESNAIFDCKVLSRNHAVLWYSNDGRFWVKDTKSSNGTFINDNKLGGEASELHYGDVVKFGVDVMENSRKEVHGCIIATVKLYLPDGRDTMSVDSSSNPFPTGSGVGRISFDELHRLNLHMQEAAQREKSLKSKLFNIQNILDVTRKNSALCWQSMIAEDQLLHRIHSLEQKLQIMEKNVPESVLRNEVLKLLDEKSSYQHSAKEALRKVYQERCEAMQMVSKLETALTMSDNECKILRDQVKNTKQSLQDVNARLVSLEAEYNEFKAEHDRKQQEAKEQSEQRAAELMDKLQQREKECTVLKRKLSDLLLKRAEMLDEEQLQRQAMEKLDSVIADMDLDEDECVDGEGGGEGENNDDGDKHDHREKEKEDDKINGDIDESIEDYSEKENTSPVSSVPAKTTEEANKHPRGRKSTILKWLENSDLKQKEGSFDIFDAICNASDSSDSSENGAGTNGSKNNNNDSEEPCKNNDDGYNNPFKDFTTKYAMFNEKLKIVQENLTKLEVEIANGTKETSSVIATTLNDTTKELVTAEDEEAEDVGSEEENEDGDNDDDGIEEEDRKLVRMESGQESEELKGNNESYMLLKCSVALLKEAYDEICGSMKQQHEQQQQRHQKQQQHQDKQLNQPVVSLQTQFQNYAQHKISKSAARKLTQQITLKPTSDGEDGLIKELRNVMTVNCKDIDADDDESSEATGRSSLQTIGEVVNTDDEETVELQDVANAVEENNSILNNSNSDGEKQDSPKLEKLLKDYQRQIKELNEKLELSECDAQNTLELMQMECDTYKDKVSDMQKLVETLTEEKRELEQVLEQNKSKAEQNAAATMSVEDIPPLEVISEQLLKSSAIEQVGDNSVAGPSEASAKKGSEEENTSIQSPSLTYDHSLPVAKHDEFEQQIHEELKVINSAYVQREEELIMYKESLEQMQKDNLRLRNEISEMTRAADAHALSTLKRMLPYGAAAVAVLIYFIFTYT